MRAVLFLNFEVEMRLFKLVPAVIAAVHLPEISCDAEKSNISSDNISRLMLKPAVSQARDVCKQKLLNKMLEVGAPGLVIGVSVDGKIVWSEGFGLADIENNIPCTPKTVMRIASISKSFTATALARLWEANKVDLDKSVQDYLPKFPEKHFSGEKVVITLRQLLSHTGGIRHYSKTCDDKTSEFDYPEYYSIKSYKNVTEALDMFKGDLLLKKPGEQFLYTTHGWTLISAVMEKASGQDFLTLMRDNFRRMGMSQTVPDHHDQLIYGRASYYKKDKDGRLINAPYVDNSYKWAGGGYLSTVGDLLKFGNVMMYSYQYEESNSGSGNQPPGILKPETVRKLWNAVVQIKHDNSYENANYGLGWFVYPEMEKFGYCTQWQLEVAHTGGAVGASSVLLLLPNTPIHSQLSFYTDDLQFSQAKPTNLPDKNSQNRKLDNTFESGVSEIVSYPPVRGVAVAIITNMQSVGLVSLASEIAHEFDEKLRSIS